MSRISIELVPRKKETFTKELETVKASFPSVDTINIPDIERYDLKSLEACSVVKPFFPHAIPHLRAQEVERDQPLPYKDFLVKNNINEVLVLFGDQREGFGGVSNPCDSICLIKKFKQEIPDIKVYAAIDQYRSSFKQEIEYIYQKIQTGADGFFTQPFFDLKLIKEYLGHLKDIEVFWGVSPVISERSKAYWEKNNKVSFPDGFEANMEWNRGFAKDALDLVKENNSHIYFMPIRADVVGYLSGII
jgi:methylenetetrahydrofolate reductase (NADPH)